VDLDRILDPTAAKASGDVSDLSPLNGQITADSPACLLFLAACRLFLHAARTQQRAQGFKDAAALPGRGLPIRLSLGLPVIGSGNLRCDAAPRAITMLIRHRFTRLLSRLNDCYGARRARQGPHLRPDICGARLRGLAGCLLLAGWGDNGGLHGNHDRSGPGHRPQRAVRRLCLRPPRQDNPDQDRTCPNSTKPHD
jgi:hypothetical protein